MDYNQIMKVIKLTRNSRGLVLQGLQTKYKTHPSHLGNYINHFGIYLINKRHIKHI